MLRHSGKFQNILYLCCVKLNNAKGGFIMATITFQYDARKIAFKYIFQLIVELGGKKITPVVKKSGIDEAMDDLKAGRLHKAKDVNDMMKQILG